MSRRTLNLGILAHVDAGKTTLTERLLYAAGVIDEIGSVDAGTTQTDSLALERQRGITIKSAVVSFAIGDVTVNLIDTPGHPDFIAEVRRRGRHNRVVACDHPFGTLPVVDVSPLLPPHPGRPAAGISEVARQIEAACREHGFFYVTGHGVAPELLARLSAACTAFFALPEHAKTEIAMARGGPAWRGYFPVGAELTSGQPDLKEGLYFGAELGDDDPRVRAGLPLHGRNLFPRQVPEMRAAVLDYIGALTGLGQAVLRGVALSLGLDADYFAAGYTARPTVLFRVFRYPAPPPGEAGWGVGEHTDYGLLTLLAQDANGGLQVGTPSGWIDAPPLAGTFVANIGDMLDRLTGGWYRSTPHRVRNVSGRDRLSFPFFFDPDFTAEIPPLPGRAAVTEAGQPRWDGQNPHAFTGTYGDYLLSKVSKVFPQLRREVLADEER